VTLALELREINVSILEAQYQMSSKANEISSLQKSMSEPSRLAEIGGTVKSINDPNSSDYDSTKPLVVLVEAGGYRVKGKINEMNANALPVGSEVTIASRMTDETWKGTISMIDWEHPGDGNEDRPYYVGGGSDEMSQSTKYPFYVELDDPTGLKLGQHVYIRLAEEDLPDVDNSIWLGSYYIVDVDSDPYVWAQDQNGKLEKRHVELGVHDEDMDTYVVQSGLTLDDYIAFPDETLKVGMKCITFDESSFTNSAETPVEE
jgi:HlyD family secretion protein